MPQPGVATHAPAWTGKPFHKASRPCCCQEACGRENVGWRRAEGGGRVLLHICCPRAALVAGRAGQGTGSTGEAQGHTRPALELWARRSMPAVQCSTPHSPEQVHKGHNSTVTSFDTAGCPVGGGGLKSGFHSEIVAALCYRRFTTSLRFHWAFTQDNYKTTTRQLQDNSQDNPQDNSFLLAGVCIHENKDISCIFNSWTALV
jgi:hypothetical protein